MGNVNYYELFDSLDVETRSFIIREMFLGYKFRKYNKKLDISESEIPVNLIRMYYGLNPSDAKLDTMRKRFVSNYIRNESKIEGINTKNTHKKYEIDGAKVMYEFIQSDEIDNMFGVFTIVQMHKKLFSLAPHPEAAGIFRNIPVFLPGTGTELSDYTMIVTDLLELDKEVKKLVEIAPEIKKHDNMDALFEYINNAVDVKCKLIKIHPFFDGNGRVSRGFLNKLFEYAGLPPVYIKDNEKTEYHRAMNLANNDGDFSAIHNFYLYKICDSIVELDINERLKSSSNRSYSEVSTESSKIKKTTLN